jgi:hypothetical protein
MRFRGRGRARTGIRRHPAPSLSFTADNLVRCCALVTLIVVKPGEMLNLPCRNSLFSLGFDTTEFMAWDGRV